MTSEELDAFAKEARQRGLTPEFALALQLKLRAYRREYPNGSVGEFLRKIREELVDSAELADAN